MGSLFGGKGSMANPAASILPDPIKKVADPLQLDDKRQDLMKKDPVMKKLDKAGLSIPI